MIDGIFLDFATKEDIATVDRLYKEERKGSAIALQLRRITQKWVELYNHKCNTSTNPQNKLQASKQIEDSTSRTIKINSYGVSKLML